MLDEQDGLPDLLQSWEDAAERRLECTDTTFKCIGCKGWFPWGQAQPSSPNPYCAPICGACFEKQYGPPPAGG